MVKLADPDGLGSKTRLHLTSKQEKCLPSLIGIDQNYKEL